MQHHGTRSRRRQTPATALALTLVLALGACGGDSDEAREERKDHVWKEQTQTIDKARDVGRQLDEAARRKDQSQ